MNKLRELLENATPGPWSGNGSSGYGWVKGRNNESILVDQRASSPYDAKLIAHLRNNAEKYLALVDALRPIAEHGEISAKIINNAKAALKALDE